MFVSRNFSGLGFEDKYPGLKIVCVISGINPKKGTDMGKQRSNKRGFAAWATEIGMRVGPHNESERNAWKNSEKRKKRKHLLARKVKAHLRPRMLARA